MPMTNFPQGFAAGLSVRGMPLLQMQPGEVFFVGNGSILRKGQAAGSNGSDGTFQRPYATLEYAVNTATVPGRGDIVFVLPGHKETIADATTLGMKSSGTAVVGLGAGNFRPRLTYSTADTANIPVTGSGMSVQNILFVGNFLSVAAAFTGASTTFTGVITANGVLTVSALTGTVVPGQALASSAAVGVAIGTVILRQLTGTTGAAGTYQTNATVAVASGTMTTSPHDFAIDNCEFRDNSTVLGFLTLFTCSATANACDGLTVINTKWWSLSSVSVTCAVVTTVAQDRVNLSDNIMNSPTTAVTEGPILLAAGAADMTNILIYNNQLQRKGVSTTLPNAVGGSGTAWTGSANRNLVGTGASGATGTWISAGTTVSTNENYSVITRAADKSGLINPVAA